MDWAPDFAIDFVADLLLSSSVKATWFLTHTSPSVDKLKEHPDLFELGLHPNFLTGSSHGETAEEVLEHCAVISDTAVSARTHGLFQSTPLLDLIVRRTSIRIDVSLFLPHFANLYPFRYRMNGRELWRVPYLWEDDFEMERRTPWWHLDPLIALDGLKVLDFHPMHVYLNSNQMAAYRSCAQSVPSLKELKPGGAEEFINKAEDGTQTLFREVLSFLNAQKQSARIFDLVPDISENPKAAE